MTHSFSELRRNLEELEKRQEFSAPSDLSLEDFVGLDDSVVATEPALSVDEIIESLQDSTDVISMEDDEIREYEYETNTMNACKSRLIRWNTFIHR